MAGPTLLEIDATQQTLEITNSRDAVSLRGRAIETGTPTNGEVLTYSTSASEWIYQSVDENVDDRVAALIQDSAGGGLTWTYDDSAGTLTPAYVGDSTLVTTGALNSGSISSGFGTINIGSSALTAGAGSFTTISGSTSLVLASGATVTGIDNGDLATGSATLLATQGAIKTYIDSSVTAQDLDIISDSGNIDIDLDSESLTLAGGTGLDSSASSTAVTFAIDSTVATLAGSQTLTNKTIAGGSNTLSAIANSSLTNSTVAYGGVTLSLGGADTTPAFNLSDATAYPGDSSLVTTGTVSSGTWQATPVATAYIADNAVTLDKMEHGTSGDVLYYGASGAPLRLAKGSDTQVLTLASGIPSWATPTVGDITQVAAGDGLSGGGSSGSVTLTLDLNELTAATVDVAADFIAIVDTNDSNASRKESIADLATAMGGTGLTGSSGQLTVDASQTQITAVGTIATGTWQGSQISGDYIDVTSSPLANTKIWIGDSSGDAAEFALSGDATMTAGGVVTVSTAAACTGNAATATALQTARTIGGTSFDGTANIVPATITVATTTDATCSVALFESATGDLAPKTDAGLTYNATSNVLAGTFSGDITGDVTGNVSGSAASLSATLAVASGGTNITSYTAGDILYASGSTTLAKLAKGSDTEVLTLASGVPSWAAPGAAAAGSLTGSTLASGVTASSLTSVGTIATGVWDAGAVTSSSTVTADTDVIIGTNPSSTGDIRLNKDFGIFTRNNANSANKLVIGENIVTGQDTLDIGDNTKWSAIRLHVSTANVMELTSSAINLNKAVTLAGDLTLATTNKINLDGGGNTYIVEPSADRIELVTGNNTAMKLGVGTANSIGGGTAGDTGLNIATTFTSDGSDSVALGTNFGGAITGAAGDTSYMSGTFFDNQIITQTATESIGLISQVRIAEPNITDNLTGDITTACSLYVHAAPTEGEDNYALYVKAGASRFDGGALVGGTTADTLYTLVPKLQVETTGSDAGLSAWRNSNDAGGAYLFLGSSRGTSLNSDTIVQDDDALGSIMFMAADGTDRGNAAASILANIDGTPGGNDTPGRLTFNTSADGSGSPTTRMTIASDGKVGLGANMSKEVNFANGPNGLDNVLHFEADAVAKWALYGYDRNNSHYTDLSLSGALIYMDKANDRVGINTSAPAGILHVKDGDTVIAPNSSADNVVVSQKSGDCGISILSGSANSIINFGDEASADDGSINYIHGDRQMRFKAADTAIFWIASDGFYLGSNAGDNQFRTSSAGSGSTTMYIGNQSITTSSDRRLKTNIVDSSLDAVDVLNQLRVTEFDWDDPSDTSFNNRNARGTWTGMIAQEVVEHLPFAVNAPRDEDKVIDYDSDSTWSIEPMAMCGVLVKAIQELSTRIQDLEAQLDG